VRFLFLACILIVQTAYAALPDDYQPLVVKPPLSFSERVIDLTPAFEKAKKLNKPMLVYLGAADCPPCKNYTLFLESHKDEMKPVLAKVVLVDIQTWLKGPKLIFKIADKRYSFDEFNVLVGDPNRILLYPSWWLLTPEGKQVRQLPRNTSKFTFVESHINLLRKSDDEN